MERCVWGMWDVQRAPRVVCAMQVKVVDQGLVSDKVVMMMLWGWMDGLAVRPIFGRWDDVAGGRSKQSLWF